MVIEREAYHPIAERIRSVLADGGIPLERARPPWMLSAPSRLLRSLGGKIVRESVPEHIEFMTGKDFELLVNPNGVTLQGLPRDTARAHALLAEAMTWTAALQTMDPEAQDLEKRIKDVWSVYAGDPMAHEGSAVLRARVHEIAEELSRLSVPFDEWEVLYRQTLQVNRALFGKEPLLEQSLEGKENAMNETEKPATLARPSAEDRAADPSALSTPTLIGEILREGKRLVEKELAMVRWLGVAVGAAVGAVVLLLVAAAFALTSLMAGWIASLAIAGALFLVAAVAGLIGWKKRVRSPLASTRKTLKEDVEWAKNRVA